jgi:hypothetical protein
MVLRPLEQVPPAELPAHEQVGIAFVRAESYLRDVVLHPVVEERRHGLMVSVEQREGFLRKGFDYREAELLDLRARLREQARFGDQSSPKTGGGAARAAGD